MRQDRGVNGDAIRLEQLTWMLLLKIVDDYEESLSLDVDTYNSPIEEKFRYRSWASNPEGITGSELIDFVNNQLFEYFKNIQITDNPLTKILRAVFGDTSNYMKNGTLLRQVFNIVNTFNFNSSKDRHDFNDIYEQLLKSLQNAKDAGEFYTPRPLTKFVTEMVEPKIGDIILDPACGTGGFLVNALEFLKPKAKNSEELKKVFDSIHGVEVKPLPHLLGTTNLILHGAVSDSIIKLDDMLLHPLTSWGPKDRVDVILANPPFGGTVEDGTELNFPSQFRTKETADLFLVLFVHLLKDGGRAGIVLPDGSLFGEGVKSKIKEHLLTECNLHTIVRLPPGVFNPYAGVNTNLLFFTKGEPTKEVWYYQMDLPKGLRAYTKTRPITDGEFDVVKEWCNNREENENAWKVSIEDIRAKNWNLDFKNPNGGEVEEELNSKEILERIDNSEQKLIKIIHHILNTK